MQAALVIRSVPVQMPSGVQTSTVVGADGLPIVEIEAFLNYLRTVDASRNTVAAYARHLALWFRWLTARGANWELLDFDGLCMFVQDLADGTVPALHRLGEARPARPRGRATQEAVLAAVCSFLDYRATGLIAR
jgi:site-specific recombinase XerD